MCVFIGLLCCGFLLLLVSFFDSEYTIFIAPPPRLRDVDYLILSLVGDQGGVVGYTYIYVGNFWIGEGGGGSTY